MTEKSIFSYENIPMLKMKRKGNKIKGLNIATWTIVIATTSAKSHDRQEN